MLAQDTIPRIVEHAEESRTIRIWSAGCSSGEEPYSVAIVLAEYLGDRASDFLVKIYGTDVDEDALATGVSYRVEGLRARIEDVKSRHASAQLDDETFTRRRGELVHADLRIARLRDSYRLVGVLVYGAEATEPARLREQMSRIAEQHATAIEELQSTNGSLG